MEKEKLKELIIQHKEGFFSKTNLTERFIFENFKRFLTSREVVLITGIRRCGKSSLMKLICDDLINKYGVSKNNILYINFDDERFVDFSVKDFEILYETFLEIESPDGRKYFFLDEIQNISGWERWVNRVYEFEDVKFFITGSNSSLLSSDVSVSLTGRNRQIILFPFSFYEFLKFKKISFDEKSIFLREKKAMIKRMFKEYVDHGGFPEVLKADDKTILEQYFKDILYRDLISGYSIRNIRELKELSLYLVSNPATIHSYESLKNFIKAKNITTIKNYIEAFEEVFLFFKVSFFDFSVKRQIYNPGKIYINDIGFSNVLGFNFSKNLGHIFENIVFQELKRRNKEVYYWKSKSGKEVDFVIKKGLKIEEAINVCFNLADYKTKSREIDSLIEAKKEIGVNKLTIITEDEEGTEKTDKVSIKIIPLWKWLLMERGEY
jgi:hypothetical protein